MSEDFDNTEPQVAAFSASQDWSRSAALCRVISPAPDRPGPVLGMGTKVLLPDGSELPGVVSVEIAKLHCGDIITAKVELYLDSVDVHATPILSERSVIEAAAHYGWKVVRDDGYDPEDESF